MDINEHLTNLEKYMDELTEPPKKKAATKRKQEPKVSAFLEAKPREDIADLEPQQSAHDGDLTPEWVVWFYLSADLPEFCERYQVPQKRAQLLTDYGVRRFIGRRTNVLVTDGSSPADEQQLEALFELFT